MFFAPTAEKLKQNKKISCIVLREDILRGQHCEKFKLLLFNSKEELVKEIYGTTIGKKRMITFAPIFLNTIELMVFKNNVVIEYFTMLFQKSTSGCDLVMAWGDMKVLLPVNFN